MGREDLHPALLWLCDIQGEPYGAGLLIGPKQVLTCAHVVATALGIASPWEGPPPTDSVGIRFTHVSDSRVRRACVSPSRWFAPGPLGDADPGAGDLTLLDLLDDPPEGAKSVPSMMTGVSPPQMIHVFGLPKGHGEESGGWADAWLKGTQASGWIQLDSPPEGYRIQPGFSGAAAWSDELNAVIGIVVAAEKSAEARVAWMIPPLLISKLCPEITLDPFHADTSFLGLLTTHFQGSSTAPIVILANEDRATLMRQLIGAQTSPSTTQGTQVDVVPNADRTRFVGREEYFGSVLYDRARGDYIPFDADATLIFKLSEQESLNRIYTRLAVRTSRKNLDTFVDLCQSIDIFDAKGAFTGVFVKSGPTPGHLSAPLQVHFSCTKACNFRCRHCFSSSGNPYANELTTAEIKRLLIDQMADLGCLELRIGGGEPLVRPDLPDIIEHANKRGVSVRIRTNAAAATRQVVETLKDVNIVQFTVSMEGATEKIYDSIRGEPGSFQQALDGIENLRELKVPIFLHRVFMKTNAGDLPELVRLAESLKVDKLVLDTVMPVGRAAENPELLLDWREANRLWDQAIAAQRGTELKIEIPHYVPFNQKYLFSGFGCKCGTMLCHVDPRGELAPTGFLKDTLSAGNLRQQSLKQIWDSGASFVKFRSFPGNEQCAACSFFADCRGGCRARAILLDHDINLPDGNCALAHTPKGKKTRAS